MTTHSGLHHSVKVLDTGAYKIVHTSVGAGAPVAQKLEFRDSNVKVICSNPRALTTGKIRDVQYLSTGYKIYVISVGIGHSNAWQ